MKNRSSEDDTKELSYTGKFFHVMRVIVWMADISKEDVIYLGVLTYEGVPS